MTPSQFLSDTIDMFLEYRDKHGCNEAEAREKAVFEMLDTDSGFEVTVQEVKRVGA